MESGKRITKKVERRVNIERSGNMGNIADLLMKKKREGSSEEERGEIGEGGVSEKQENTKIADKGMRGIRKKK